MFSADFEDDPDLYVFKPIKYVGIDVWQVTHITPLIFNYILLCKALVEWSRMIVYSFCYGINVLAFVDMKKFPFVW